jgi:hypothetical protein
MRSSLLVRASDCQCRSRNSPWFDPSILRHSGICGAADEAVFNIVHRKKNQKNHPVIYLFQLRTLQVLSLEGTGTGYLERER